MTRIDLTSGGTHPFRVKTLEVRIQRVILTGDQIPRRNRLPGRRIDCRGEYRVVDRLLRGAYDLRCALRQVCRENVVHLVTCDVQVTGGVGAQRRTQMARILIGERANGLICFGSKRSEVDERLDVRISRGGPTD